MQEMEVEQTLRELAKYPPRKLFKIWWKQKPGKWTRDKYEVMRLALVDRRELLLPPETDRGVLVRAKFMKKRIRPIKKYGLYRGPGVVYLDEAGIAVTGKHVFSVAKRWGIALAVFVVCAVATAGALAPGVIPLYILVEYSILKKQNLWIPYSQVFRYAAKPRKGLVSVEFHGPPQCSPIVFKSEDWQRILWMLRNYVPQCDATPQVRI